MDAVRILSFTCNLLVATCNGISRLLHMVTECSQTGMPMNPAKFRNAQFLIMYSAWEEVLGWFSCLPPAVEIRGLCCSRHQVSPMPFASLLWISLALTGTTHAFVKLQADVSPTPGDLHFCVLINNLPKIHDAHFTASPSLCPLIHVPRVYFWHSSFRAAYKPLLFF